MTYSLEVDRERDGVILSTRMQAEHNNMEGKRERDGVRLRMRIRREHDNVLSRGGEGASWCEIVDADAKRARQRTL